jgi:hypothetical protein
LTDVPDIAEEVAEPWPFLPYLEIHFCQAGVRGVVFAASYVLSRFFGNLLANH